MAEFRDIPNDIVRYILEFLPQIDLASVFFVSKKLYKLANSLIYNDCRKLLCRRGDIISIIRHYYKWINKVYFYYIIENLAKYGYEREVLVLLRLNMYTNNVLYIRSGLIGACKGGHINIIKSMFKQLQLLENYVFINNEMVYAACMSGRLNIIKWILRLHGKQEHRVNSDAVIYWDEALSAACSSGNIPSVKYIIKIGGDISDNIYAMRSACKSGNIKLIELMTKYYKDNGRSIEWEGGIYNACTYGHINIVKLILNKLSYKIITQKDIINECLFETACGGHMDIIKFLIEYNEEIYSIYSRHSPIPVYGKMKPIDWNRGIIGACHGFTKSQFEIKNRVKIIKFLIDKYSKQDGIKNVQYYLQTACGSGCIEIIKLIISLGGTDFNNGLIEACRYGQQAAVDLMIKLGADKLKCTEYHGINHE